MENKIYKIAILGVGARGKTYGSIAHNLKDKFKIVSLCDKNSECLKFGQELYDVPDENAFLEEDEFFKEQRADLLIVATQDRDHVRHCLRAFEAGYHVLTEKPLTDSREECKALLDAQKKSGKKALVCHVLRYAPAFLKVAELLESGTIGRLVAIEATEPVCWWHQAHSFVRGNWRTTKEAAPMILAKCCHDLDLLQFYAGSKCKSISSIGSLTYFTPENAPKEAAKRCLDCQLANTCPYSAKRLYLDLWDEKGGPENAWPYNVLTLPPVTKEKLVNALKTGPYGRCVYYCDNDVVDHQLTQMTFENGVKASLTMTAFSALGGRRMTFYGTLGEIILAEGRNIMEVMPYGEDEQKITLSDLNESGYGHGGGDQGLIDMLYDMLEDRAPSKTSFEESVESHLMGICAEESRLQGGKLIYVHDDN